MSWPVTLSDLAPCPIQGIVCSAVNGSVLRWEDGEDRVIQVRLKS